MTGKEGSWGGEGPPPRMPKGRKKGTGRGGSLTCQGSAPVKEIDRWTDKGTKGQTQGRRKMARGQSSQGQGCTECLGLSRPTPHPNPGPPAGGRCLAPSAQEGARATPLEGPPVPTAPPRPPGVAAARFQPGWGATQTEQQQGRGASDRRRGRGRGQWVGRSDIPILLQGAVSGQGRPEGPGRLVEGGAGCKGVPRGVRGGGQGLGRDRAGQGRQGRGCWTGGGCPPWCGEDSGSPAPH